MRGAATRYLFSLLRRSHQVMLLRGNNIINGGQIKLRHGFDRGFSQCHGPTYRFLYLPPTHTHTHTHTDKHTNTNKSLCWEWGPSISTNNQIILQESFTSLGLSITNGERQAYTHSQPHTHTRTHTHTHTHTQSIHSSSVYPKIEYTHLKQLKVASLSLPYKWPAWLSKDNTNSVD